MALSSLLPVLPVQGGSGLQCKEVEVSNSSSDALWLSWCASSASHVTCWVADWLLTC